MRSAALAVALSVLCRLAAQPVTVELGSFMFSTGVHPTFDARFEGTDVRSVENFWKSELKAISVDVTNKKELIGIAARIPSVSPDTLHILIKAERPKGYAWTTAHIAIRTGNGFVGPDAPDRERTACEAYVQQRAVTFQRQLAQAAVEKGERDLSRLKNDLEMLVREKARAEGAIEKNKQKDAEAVKEKGTTDQELEKLGPEMEALAKEQAATPTAEGAKELKDKQKDRTKLQDRSRRLADTSVGAQKKVKVLEWEIKKNIDDQAAKQKDIGKQEAVVAGLREKLGSIR